MNTYIWEPKRSYWKTIVGAVILSAVSYSCHGPLEIIIRKQQTDIQMPSGLNKDSIDKFLGLWSMMPEHKRKEMLKEYVPEREETEGLREALLGYKR